MTWYLYNRLDQISIDRIPVFTHIVKGKVKGNLRRSWANNFARYLLFLYHMPVHQITAKFKL